jgi:PAS domain S-box-containing protein
VSFIAGLAALLINADYQTRVASVERENSNLAKSFEGHLLRTISSADRILKLAKTEFESEQRITPAIRTMLTTDASDPAIIQNVIVDSQGNFLAAKTPPPAAMNLAQRTYFQAHIDSPEAGLIISNPIMSEATGKWSIVLSRRLNKPDGSFGGIVAAALSTEYFERFYRQMNLFKGDVIALNSTDGMVLVRVGHDKVELGVEAKRSALYRFIEQKTVDSILISSAVDAETRFVSYRVLPDYPLIVVVGSNMDRALAPYRQRRSVILWGAFGSCLFIIGTGLLIHRQRGREIGAHQAQLVSQEKYMKIFDVSPDSVTINRVSDGLYLEANQGFCKLLGYTREEAIGKTSLQLDVWGDPTDRRKWAEALQSSGEISEYEVALRTKAGQIRICDTSAKFIELEGALCVLTVTRDITARKQAEIEIKGLNEQLGLKLREMQEMNATLEEEIAERQAAQEALAENEARYRAVVEQAAEAVLLIDFATGEIIEANARFTAQFGYDLNKDGPLKVYDITVDDPERINAMIVDLKVTGEAPEQRRIVRHKNGRYVSADRSATVIHYRDRDIIAVTLRDVSGEVRREKEIRRDAEMATRIQNALLSAPPASEYLEIAAIYQPSEFVGGDLYFMDWRYDGSLLRGFLVDATGHGLGTALHTASLHVLIREVNERDLPLAETMSWLNRRAGEYFDEASFACAIGFELDLQTRQLRWSCAGIPKIWVATQSRQGMIEAPGMCWTINSEETFDVHTLQVDVGDSFYFMTDGLTDQLDKTQELPLAQYQRLVERLREMAVSPECKDDATAICIHIRALPQSMVRQDGWPRIMRLNGYGDYQRFKGEVAKILAEVTGKAHSIQEVAVHEALANAMECRDGVPRQHKARLRFNKVGNRLIVRVKTSRIGFAGNAILRRLRSHPEDLFSYGEDAAMGRGIPIMLSTTHKMTYNNEGTELLLSWKL